MKNQFSDWFMEFSIGGENPFLREKAVPVKVSNASSGFPDKDYPCRYIIEVQWIFPCKVDLSLSNETEIQGCRSIATDIPHLLDNGGKTGEIIPFQSGSYTGKSGGGSGILQFFSAGNMNGFSV